METAFTVEERERVKEGIREKYVKVAAGAEGNFNYPIGRAGLVALGYDPEMMNKLPATVLSAYCGVGNPFSLGPVRSGESVLDIGCGAGVDDFFAAMMVGPQGRVAGIDIVPEMIEKATKNLEETGITNVSFQLASAESLPFEDESFHVVISNGALNLVPDKSKALAEALRVMKPGGRLMIADQVRTDPLPEDKEERVKSWYR